MKVCVLGLWHLGTVTAACLAAGGHNVTGLDFEPAVVANLTDGTPPLFEPGLEGLVRAGLAAGRLTFTTHAADACREADVVWVAYDTPVDDDDRADVDFVVERVARLFPHLRDGALVLISSQVPVGSTRRLEERFAAAASSRRVAFAYSPENLRLGKAIEVFTRPDRVVVGVRSDADRVKVAELIAPFTQRIEWMSVESAEMTKHALNAFLATSVTFINEIAAVCEQVGADATEVERGLKSEMRIGPKAYLSPGGAFAGGTLARDIMFLSQLGSTHSVPTHLLSSVKTSNDAHRQWAQRRLTQLLSGVGGKTVAVWGLTYKPGTDTLRRSSSIELCHWLALNGALVRAHDPAVRSLPADLSQGMTLVETALSAVEGASALVVATPWPEYRQVIAADVAARMSRMLVLDANRFLGETVGRLAGAEYVSVGKAGV
jgi:UDPglucose 6-dehydrogenase